MTRYPCFLRFLPCGSLLSVIPVAFELKSKLDNTHSTTTHIPHDHDFSVRFPSPPFSAVVHSIGISHIIVQTASSRSWPTINHILCSCTLADIRWLMSVAIPLSALTKYTRTSVSARVIHCLNRISYNSASLKSDYS